MFRLLLTTTLFIFYISVAYAQLPNLNLEVIDASKGLESAVVFQTMEDEQGLVWICTYDGLYVYDGYRARRINIRLCDSCQGINLGVYYMARINPSEAFILSTYGIARLNLVSGTMKIVITADQSEGFDFLYLLDDTLVQATGLHRYPFLINRFTNEYTQLSKSLFNASTETRHNIGIEKDSFTANRFFVPLAGIQIDRVPGALRFINRGSAPQHLLNINSAEIWHSFQFVSFDKPDTNGFNYDIRDSLGRSMRSVLFGPDPPTAFSGHVKDKFDNIWISSSKGLLVLAPKGKKAFEVGEIYQLLKSQTITSIRIDNQQILWLGLRGKGLVKAEQIPSAFSNISSTSTKGKALYKDFILGFYPAANGRLVINHDFQYNVPNTVLDLKHITTQFVNAKDLELFDQLSYDHQPLFRSPAFYAGVDSIKKQLPKEQSLDKIHIMPGKKKGEYYTIQNFGALKSMPSGKILVPQVQAIFSKYQGDTLWLGNESSGLIALHIPTANIRLYKHIDGSNDGLPHNRIHGFCFDAKGNLWIATSNGLSYLDKQQQRFTNYSTTAGLCHPVIYCITMDKQGMLWLGTGNGLSRFDTSSKKFTNFFTSDGLINSEYNRKSAYTADDGRVFMGGTKGIDYFDPLNIQQTTVKINPLITDISLPNKRIDPAFANQFGNTENNLFFSFSVSPISEAKNCTYLYKLENGKSGPWIKMTSGHELQFANLSPGKYRLLLKAVNQYGEVSSKEAGFSFEIAAPWYATWWFRLLAVLIAALIVYTAIAVQQKQKLKKALHESQIIKLKAEQTTMLIHERERITADLHDDVGATLSSLHIYGDLAGQALDKKPAESKAMIEKITQQSKALMLRMNDIVWSLKEADTDSGDFILRVKNYCQEFLSNKGIAVTYQVDEALSASIVNPLARKNLLLIVKEAVNNVAKYSQASSVSCMLCEQTNYLMLSISDNGVGFNGAAAKAGNGLSNMALRCKQLGGTFNLSSENGKGTIITCIVPIAIISHTG